MQKRFLPLVVALLLITSLFFILDPMGDEPIGAEGQTTESKESPRQEVKTLTEIQDDVDKIAEFPILPKQREKLKELQKQRLNAIKGMEPQTIEIPSIGVKATVQPTGVLENGEMGVPDDPDEVGWFEPGYKVGAKGHSVLAGHVDSTTGPAIFYDLKDVEVGEQVIITDSTGREMVFEVTNKVSYKTEEAPIREIFGPSNQQMLNLITCTGTFNRDVGSHDQRLVVTTKLVSDSSVLETEPEAPSNISLNEATSTLSWHAVRDDAIIGYRIYAQDPKTGEMEKIQTVSLFDRKKVVVDGVEGTKYFISSVDVDLNESEPAEMETE